MSVGVGAAAAGMADLLGGVVARWRAAGFDKGRRVHDMGVPVISVGNITVGGTGKTPMVQWIAGEMLAAGLRPAIALRGYKARDGVSDEALEHVEALGDVPVLVGASRVATISAAIERGIELDCVVLDDGFQHRFVKRDLDIVLVDARRRPDCDHMLPVGRLREPTWALKRADALVVTHAAHADDDLMAALTTLHGRPPLAACDHAWTGLQVIDGDTRTTAPLDRLEGCSLVTRCAVAGPAGVAEQARAYGATVVADCPARDHEAATTRTLEQLRGACADHHADAVLMTAKDMATMRPLLEARPLDVPVFVPTLSLQFSMGEAALRARVAAVLEGGEP